MSRRWARLAWGTVALVGVGMLVAFPIVAHVFLHDDWLLAAIGLHSAGRGRRRDRVERARRSRAARLARWPRWASRLPSRCSVLARRMLIVIKTARHWPSASPSKRRRANSPRSRSFHYFPPEPGLLHRRGRSTKFEAAERSQRLLRRASRRTPSSSRPTSSFETLRAAAASRRRGARLAGPASCSRATSLLLGRVSAGATTASKAGPRAEGVTAQPFAHRSLPGASPVPCSRFVSMLSGRIDAHVSLSRHRRSLNCHGFLILRHRVC